MRHYNYLVLYWALRDICFRGPVGGERLSQSILNFESDKINLIEELDILL